MTAAVFRAADLVGILPVLIVALGAAGALVTSPGVGDWGRPRRGVAYMTLVTLGVALLAQLVLWKTDAAPGSLFAGALVADAYAHVFGVMFLATAILTALAFSDTLDRIDVGGGEPYVLLLLATAGMMLMAQAAELIALFVALETMSLAVYVLTGMRRRDPRGSEAALKYFLLGAFGSALLLYGIALVYGNAGGHTSLVEVGKALRALANPRADAPLLIAGIGLVIVGFAFKIAAVPLHMWTPDVYEGAPTVVTGLMAAGVKAASFAALGRFLLHVLGGTGGTGAEVLAARDALLVMAVLTMTLGNLVALGQTNIKRLLAYSSIAHTGYLMLGLAALLTNGAASFKGLIFYLLAYTFMTVGAFAVAALLERRDDRAEHAGLTLDSDTYRGLFKRHPALAISMAIFMFALAGVPPTAGFFGKFHLFLDAVDAGLTPWVVVALLNSALGAYYYLRVTVALYMESSTSAAPPPRLAPAPFAAAAVTVCVILTLVLGLLPTGYLAPATRTVTNLAAGATPGLAPLFPLP